MDELDFNAGFSLTSPLPYVLVTSVDGEGRPNVMGASWVTRISFEPFLMAVSVRHDRYSNGLIKNCREFVICYPSAEQEKEAMYCGTHSGRLEDKFARTGLVALESKKVRPPTVDECTVAFECRLAQVHEVGDHTLFVGEVVTVTGNPARSRHVFATTGKTPLCINQKGNL